MSSRFHRTAGGRAETFQAADLNLEAHLLLYKGNFRSAELLYLGSLELFLRGTGEDSYQTARLRTNLGKLYLLMEGKWEDAKKMLEAADRTTSVKTDFFAASTRDFLGQLWEVKGDFAKAKAARERFPDSMICSNYMCPKVLEMKVLKRGDLGVCSRCRCAWYCSVKCQREDRRTRHIKWCKPWAKAPAAESTEHNMESTEQNEKKAEQNGESVEKIDSIKQDEESAEQIRKSIEQNEKDVKENKESSERKEKSPERKGASPERKEKSPERKTASPERKEKSPERNTASPERTKHNLQHKEESTEQKEDMSNQNRGGFERMEEIVDQDGKGIGKKGGLLERMKRKFKRMKKSLKQMNVDT